MISEFVHAFFIYTENRLGIITYNYCLIQYKYDQSIVHRTYQLKGKTMTLERAMHVLRFKPARAASSAR